MPRGLLASLLLLMASPLTAWACGYIPQDLYAKTLYWAERFGVPPNLAVALVWTESRYCPQAVGAKGEIGLGQMLPSTARSLGVPPSYLYDPDWNLYASMLYLQRLYRRFGDWNKALAAYNAGPGRAHQPPRTTQIYVYRVVYVVQALKSRMPPRRTP
ncbi:Membrane-bound lytic murein transglycosylase D [bacterium HR39]|nr:Membrane-bound lytic murein transglycosylase D [bacterium HR39]